MHTPIETLLEEALAVALGVAPDAADWLARCADWPAGRPLPAPRAPEGALGRVDEVLDRTWRRRPVAERTVLGQVFTPRPVARQLLLELGWPGPGHLLDPACGGGIFLAEAAAALGRALLADGVPPAEAAARVLERIHGVDIDPDAARLARLLLGLEGVRLGGGVPDRLPDVRVGDATDPAVRASFGSLPVSWVAGNPPYLEAKRMPKDLRQTLRDRFGDRLQGAFDAWVPFVWLAADLVGPEGHVGLVLPNKATVAKYAGTLREALTPRLRALVDLSELPVFARVGVYPVLVVLGPPGDHYRSAHAVPSLDGLGVAPLAAARLPSTLPGRVSSPPIWLTLPDGPLAGLVDRLVGAMPGLGAQAEARSTVSFHAKGLRERYVRPGDELQDGLPYLGGRSFSRRNEVRPFGVDWAGYRIRYAADELRALGNPLPPLDRFLRSKVVLCQHARTAVAFWDVDGRWVTKDVFPILLPRDDAPQTAGALAALLGSRVFSVLYASLFRGIAISSGYLHFLPAFLSAVPAPPLDGEAKALADAVGALQSAPDAAAWEALDDRISDLYGLTLAERAAVGEAADALGFAPDPFARR